MEFPVAASGEPYSEADEVSIYAARSFLKYMGIDLDDCIGSYSSNAERLAADNPDKYLIWKTLYRLHGRQRDD